MAKENNPGFSYCHLHPNWGAILASTLLFDEHVLDDGSLTVFEAANPQNCELAVTYDLSGTEFVEARRADPTLGASSDRGAITSDPHYYTAKSYADIAQFELSGSITATRGSRSILDCEP
jgi:hypothetical protein